MVAARQHDSPQETVPASFGTNLAYTGRHRKIIICPRCSRSRAPSKKTLLGSIDAPVNPPALWHFLFFLRCHWRRLTLTRLNARWVLVVCIYFSRRAADACLPSADGLGRAGLTRPAYGVVKQCRLFFVLLLRLANAVRYLTGVNVFCRR